MKRNTKRKKREEGIKEEEKKCRCDGDGVEELERPTKNAARNYNG